MDISFEEEKDFDVNQELNQLESDIFSSQKQDRTFLEFFEPLPEKKLLNNFSNIDEELTQCLTGDRTKPELEKPLETITAEVHDSLLVYDGQKKRKGRLRNADKDNCDLLSGTHSKFAHDNVKNKIKTQFHKFAIQFYVDYLKNKLHVKNLTFRKIARNYTKNITISENKALMNMTMGELLNYDVSKKYRDKTEQNKLNLEIILKRNYEFDFFAKMKYMDFFNDYYLHGNKEELVNNYGLKKAKLFADFLDEKRKTECEEYIEILEQEAKGYVNYYLTKKPRTRRAKKTMDEEDY